ncbi:MAG: DNA repair protein RadC [Planctomycetota bacterium]
MSNKPSDITGQSDRELLSTLLRSEAKAGDILRELSIGELVHAHRNELKLTPKAYERLQASIEIGRRINEARENYQAIIKIGGSKDAIEFCRICFRRLMTDALQEEFHIITLDSKNRLIKPHQITVGTLDASLVHPREVFRPAIKDSASSIILCHNHPSGDPIPSREDFAVTDRLAEVGKTIGVDVLDHIVLGREKCVSIQECR